MTDNDEALPLLDQSILEELLGSVEIAAMPILMQSLEKEIGGAEADILEAATKHDWRLLEIKAHALKSAAASFGALRLSQHLLVMEGNAREDRDDVVLKQQCIRLSDLARETREAFGWG